MKKNIHLQTLWGILLSIAGMILCCGCGSSGSSSGAPGTTSNSSGMKVAVLYERVSDGIVIGRTASDVLTIFNDTRAEFIFRGFFRWEPVPESPDAALAGYSADYVAAKAVVGYTYQQLGNAVSAIKSARPDTLFIGAVAAQRLNRIEVNDKTGSANTAEQTWAMALDPATLGLAMTKEELQCRAAKFLGWISSSASCPADYDHATAPAFFPDITNEAWQELLLSRAKKQIDLGADGIWIDMLFTQARLIELITSNSSDPAVAAAYQAASKIIDQIHAYGTSQYGKSVLVGTWLSFLEIGYTPASYPAVNFVTASPSADEILNGIDRSQWTSIKSSVKAKLGETPLYVFIDWNGSATAPLGVFSQNLTTGQQESWLEAADKFFTEQSITFIYPVHGGTFPTSSAKLSFGKYNVYDSLAPEFATYQKIKSLAQAKSAQ